MTSPVIALNNVRKQFNDVVAVDDVSLSLEEGEFFALLGPSGCGKTTLLRMLAGFEQPDRGQILLDGNDITRLDANRRPLNMMFQSYALFPHMTVRGNVSYGLEIEKLDRAAINQRVNQILEVTRIESLADRKPTELSGGQRQRAALARALVKQPRVLLLDEPLAALDKKLREQMQIELKRLQDEFAITFVVVTHDQEEALVMADRIGLMQEGRLVQVSSPGDLYDQPASRFAAEFIGRTNFLDGKACDGGLEHDALGLVRAEKPDAMKTGSPCTLSVRPERIRISRDRLDDFSNAFTGLIADTAFYGQHTTAMVQLDGLSAPVEVTIPADADNAPAFLCGDTVWCQWRSEHGRLLSAD